MYELAERMRHDMNPEEVLRFAEALNVAAEALENQFGSKKDKPHGAGRNGEWDNERCVWVFKEFSTFERSLAYIRGAADWYEKVGRMGCRVHAS